MQREWFALFVIVSSTFCLPSKAQATGPKQSLCPFCQQPVLKDDSRYDNKVTLVHDGKSQDYRCVMCALAEAKDLKGDLTILAPSEKKGQPAKIVRADGKWSVTPESTVFTFAPGSHDRCQDRYRAITCAAAFEAYIESDRKLLGNAKSLSLSELIDRSK